MGERRGNPRHPYRARCQLRVGKHKHDAMLLDVSSSGLSIHTALELGQGEPVDLSIAPDLEIRAIAWRTSRARNGFVTGLMLSDVTPAYESFVAGLERHTQPRAAERPNAPPPPPEPERKPEPDPVESWWRLRVKESDGPRTRVVTLAAPTRATAIERAMAEIGEGWEVLEARPAPPVGRA